MRALTLSPRSWREGREVLEGSPFNNPSLSRNPFTRSMISFMRALFGGKFLRKTYRKVKKCYKTDSRIFLIVRAGFETRPQGVSRKMDRKKGFETHPQGVSRKMDRKKTCLTISIYYKVLRLPNNFEL